MDTEKIFVYGTLRRTGYNNHILEDSKFLGELVVPKLFKMVSLVNYPALTPDPLRRFNITGEVYEVLPSVLQRVDDLEGHPTFYKRMRIPTPLGRVWVYIINDLPLYARETVASGDWMDHIAQRKGKP